MDPDSRIPTAGTQAIPAADVPDPTVPLPVPSGGARGVGPVRWLSPSQLLNTAVEVVQGTIFSRFADKREVMGGVPGVVFKLNEGERGAWVDYVADTGDGFNATFATASSVMRAPNIVHGPLEDGASCACAGVGHAERKLVVLGGDEVYPVASSDAYHQRLHDPYERARRMAEEANGGPATLATPVLTLPGNHDWYDGLVAFRRAFCEAWAQNGYEKPSADGQPPPVDPPAQDGRVRLTRLLAPENRDEIAGLGAVQSRSYFAIRLTSTWWLWGLDSQLDKPIDAVQLRYFRDAAALVGEHEKVILCTATPTWLRATAQPSAADSPHYTLAWFLDRVPTVRPKVRLVLTGDKHHYAHYQPVTGSFVPELVTCGGGGAFMSSTHHLADTLSVAWGLTPDEPDVTEYRLRRTFPHKDTESRQLSQGGRWLKVPWMNGNLPVLLAVLQLALLLTTYWGWRSVRGLTTTYQPDRWPLTWPILWAVLGMLVLLGVLVAFAAHGARGTTRSPWLAGGLHTAAQWAPTSWAAFWLSGWDDLTLVWGWGILLWLAVALWSLVAFALYLHLCDMKGMHELESYSGLRIEGFKSHLRIHLEGETCTVHALGIRDVADYRQGSLDQPVHLEHLETITVT